MNKIPSGWQLVLLGDLGTFKNGLNKEKGDFGHGYPFVNLMDVFGKPTLSDQFRGLVNSSESERAAYNLKRGDVLFVRSSVKPEGVGLTAVVLKDLPETTYSGFLIRYRCENTITDSFKQQCFSASAFRRELLRHSTISANTNINQEALSKLPLLLPPQTEQEAIARVLNHYDKGDATLFDLITLKQRRKRSLMQELLTGKSELRRSNAGGWRRLALGNILNFEPRVVPKPTAAFLAAGIRSHGKGVFLKPDFDAEDIALDELFQLRTNDLVVNITFAWEGAVAIVPPQADGALVSHRFPTFTFKDGISCPDYFRHVIQQKSFVHDLGMVSPGGAGRNRVLSKSNFLRIQVILPSLDEQKRIAAVLNGCDREIELLQKQRDSLKEQKRGLMQKLLTGEVRVKLPKGTM